MAKELLGILRAQSGAEGDMKLQHALLSTLRNLVIPKANKKAVIDAGLVEVALPMLLDVEHQPPVVFKLLGTMRMVVDGQETLAKELLENGLLIGRLVEWSTAQDVTGGAVNGESSRLMAWLVKHAFLKKFRREGDGESKEKMEELNKGEIKALKEFVRVAGAVNSMVEMLKSQHLVMQNESLVALTIIVSFLRGDGESLKEVERILVEANVGGNLAAFMRNQSETMTKEIVDNLKTLLEVLGRGSEAVREHLKSQKVEEELKNIPVHVEYCTL